MYSWILECPLKGLFYVEIPIRDTPNKGHNRSLNIGCVWFWPVLYRPEEGLSTRLKGRIVLREFLHNASSYVAENSNDNFPITDIVTVS